MNIKTIHKITLIMALSVGFSCAGDFESKCASCHGAKGEKMALGKSKVINTFTKAQIVSALKGYKKGTYGGEMKTVMQGNVKGLSSKQITAIANQIGQ